MPAPVALAYQTDIERSKNGARGLRFCASSSSYQRIKGRRKGGLSLFFAVWNCSVGPSGWKWVNRGVVDNPDVGRELG